MIELAPANEALRKAALGWLSDERSNKSLGYRKGIEGVFDAKLSFASAIEREGSSGILGIYEDGEAVGYIMLSESIPIRRTMRFQLFIEPDSRDAGFAGDALAKLADRVLLDTRLHRLETEILATNKPALDWLKHEGFTQESFRKHSWWSNESPHSTVVLRMLTPDWRRRRKARRESPVEEVA